MTFEELPEYKREIRDLAKRYRTLNEDVQIVKKVLAVSSDERPPLSFRIDGLGVTTCVVKIKKIACRALKGKGVNSGLRLIYGFFKNEEKIVFIQLYDKNDKVSEDRQRIIKYFK
jgi:hypothetical protein